MTTFKELGIDLELDVGELYKEMSKELDFFSERVFVAAKELLSLAIKEIFSARFFSEVKKEVKKDVFLVLDVIRIYTPTGEFKELLERNHLKVISELNWLFKNYSLTELLGLPTPFLDRIFNTYKGAISFSYYEPDEGEEKKIAIHYDSYKINSFYSLLHELYGRGQ